MKTIAVLGVLGALSAATMAVGQEFPTPQKEHAWLTQFVGEWETQTEASAGPGQPEMKCQGTMSARMLGGFWIVSQWNTEMMGMRVSAVQTIGYDGESKEYIGTWVDSMLNHVWKYQGSVDASGKILTLEAEGPNFMQGGKSAKFRDAYEFKSKDHIVMTSSMQDEDGNWVTFMTGDVRRKQ
jgi:hypothetical protein